MASGAHINWNKSSCILIGVEQTCDWCAKFGFTWLAHGQPCRYLGFHVGLDVIPAQQFEPILVSIWRKLCHWSQSHLSLGVHALVVNEVLFATTWYKVACWMLHDGVIAQLKWLMCNFLWVGFDATTDTKMRVARVAWRTLILLKERDHIDLEA